jgi:CheY-like chemotaxis protein
MTSEQNAPEVESHQGSTMSPVQQDGEAQFTPHNVQHGMGQSKSSRRRRRKRKNKGIDAQPGAQAGGEQIAGQPIASIQGSAAPQTSQPQNFQANAGQQNGSSGGGKRWKKKFRDRDRQRSPENPGNVASGSNGGGYSNNGGGYRDRDTHQPGNNSGGFKRKGGKQQQRGPRSFVGPMDHSYRVVNGNFAETPPSTIESGNGNYGRSNGHGGGRSYQSDSQPIDYSQGRTIPIPENAPTKIFFFIEDLFFIAKIQETARKLGVKVAFVKNEKDAIAALTAGEDEDLPGLIVFDLNNANAKPLTLIPKLKAKLKRNTSIVGFLSHLQGDLKAKAVEAGCDTVMPRAAFSQNLPNLLRRYGMEEEEEPNFNQ